MPRRYRRRHRYSIARPLKTTKYSNETYAFSFTHYGSVGQNAAFSKVVVPPSSGILGTRKCKNFTLRIKLSGLGLFDISQNPPEFDSELEGSVYVVLVYVPEGNNPSPVNIGSATAASLYEPNQNVILSALVDINQVYAFKTRLARNLNSGDSIGILFCSAQPGTSTRAIGFHVDAAVNYAIAF